MVTKKYIMKVGIMVQRRKGNGEKIDVVVRMEGWEGEGR
jgi:hypothetical protein